MESKTFAIFPDDGKILLPALCTDLLEKQKKSWPALAFSHAELACVQTRLLSCDGYDVYVQFNPARQLSSGAAVDQASIQRRPCFLCTRNLPAGQKGILYRNEYLILCNPAPIFAGHFTIVHLQHLPQAITVSLGRLLDLTADMSPNFTLLYNGPACGASAPDHLHFQAIPCNSLPLPQSLPGFLRIIRDAEVKIYWVEGVHRTVLIIDSSDKESLVMQFDRMLKVVQNVISINHEPMINALCSYTNNVWRLMIFLRAKHRPAAYYLEGEQRVFVSPGSIDMAGVIITPLKLDFSRLDCENIKDIYREVSLAEDVMSKIINEL